MTPGPDAKLLHEARTRSIIGAFFAVYNELGYGFLESVYSAALEEVLLELGHSVAREVGVTVYFRDMPIAHQRLDMLVDDCIVLELKSTSMLARSAVRQLTNYLRATNLEVGLLLHFGPEAKFYRVVSSNRNANATRQRNPSA